jgi:tetratricopeptide (TPR) repeat protein
MSPSTASPDLMKRAAGLRAAEDFGGAEKLYRQATASAPADPEPHHHLAGVLVSLQRLDEAESSYRRALALAPRAAATARAFAVLLLSQGRYAEGFALFEARHELAQMAKPALPFPEWRGESVAGRKLLIWPEQGMGDQIQFARFAPVLKAMGADVTLICLPPLARLFEASLGVRVLAARGAVDFPDPDFWVMTMSLAARLGVTPQSVPNEAYLKSFGSPGRLPSGCRIGLMTRGNPHHANDRHRSLPDDQAERLRRLSPDVIGLDPAETGAKDFADTAAIIDQLDLVISVDTSVAHLAGAMGKPCWTLLPAHDVDWRWGLTGDRSPWYPSMRLYRQAADSWDATVSVVAADAAGLLAGSGEVS